MDKSPLKLTTPEGKPAEKPVYCHRFMIPIPMVRSVEVPGFGTKTEDASKLAFVPCLKEGCALWNVEKKKCSDVLKADALDRIATAMEEDALSMHVE